MKIVSYNVNGIRAAIKKGLITWLKDENIDILCIQETKAQEEQIDFTLFEYLGYKYNYAFSAKKKGYSGVCVFSKIEPVNVIRGQENEKFDSEGRTIQIEFKKFTLVNTYFPSGSSGEIRQKFKYDFLDDYFIFINKLQKKGKDLIVVGDYNICHLDIDIHNPKRQKNTSGFLPKEREWLDKWFANNLVDSFRYINGNILDKYSWWSYRANARKNNKGWRIDYISVSEKLANSISTSEILMDVNHSDHCPVMLDIF